ncbi:DNA-binding response regulator [Burkholderia cepacia]|uniref:DNA-binding response regulator n=1 Tax=Burkholderia cepacia TaxID=292 RepID=A0A2S8I2R8_BURCE|nr:response regulator transcription factor [Burkholderia cepacia]PQP08998.1 DNA-binding response regulator [Burkholderia cepacia]HDR9511651.1 response regulator transcription factor [Burkholderia cepacia]
MIKVAISDAHSVIRSGVRGTLEATDEFTVVGEAYDRDSTLALVHSIDADVLTLGLIMPGVSGVELIELIRKDCPSLRVLVLTRRSEEEWAVRAFKSGASGFVSKFSPAADLVAAVRKVARGGIYVSLAFADQLACSLDNRVDASPHHGLSGRELDVLVRIASGESLDAIAHALGVSKKTIGTHKAHVLEKLGLQGDAALVRYVYSHKVIPDDSSEEVDARE